MRSFNETDGDVIKARAVELIKNATDGELSFYCQFF